MRHRSQFERLEQRVEGLAQQSDGRPVYVWSDRGETEEQALQRQSCGKKKHQLALNWAFGSFASLSGTPRISRL